MKNILGFKVVLLLLLCSCNDRKNQVSFTEWDTYHGDETASHYSSLNQINKQNVNNLSVAWEFKTNDKDERSQIQCNPIIVDGVLYATSPQIKVFALDAQTGEKLWIFDPFKGGMAQGVNRGVVSWKHDGEHRIVFTAGPYLYMLDAGTGKPVIDFGDNGRIDLHHGLDRKVDGLDITATTPGIINNNLLILGSRVLEGEKSAPGHIRAFDLITGKQKWIFHTIPHPGEKGYDTWPVNAWKDVGGANSWGGFSLDVERGMVFVPTGSPAFDFHGGNRKGDNLFGNSLIALEAQTGKYVWHYQMVHHDLWDRDLPCQPNLLTIEQDGKQVDVVAQVTKQGYVFVFERETGKPVFPINEVAVPSSPLIKEYSSPTQPIPSKPASFSGQNFTLKKVNNLVPGARDTLLKKIGNARMGGPFEPSSEEGTLIYPGFNGGADWGGAAVDPTDGTLYVNSIEMVYLLKMIPKKMESKSDPGKVLYQKNCVSCHGEDLSGQQHVFPSLVNLKNKLNRVQTLNFIENGKGRMPGFSHLTQEEKERLLDFLYEKEKSTRESSVVRADSSLTIPYHFNGYRKVLTSEGYPAVKPPWGLLNAIDLNTGEFKWKVPLGEFPELTKKGIPPTGTENYGGPVVTAGGIVFIAATKDEKIRAFDKDTGEILWEHPLPAAGYATPATYSMDGKQFLVIACGGGKIGSPSGDSYMAFSLP